MIFIEKEGLPSSVNERIIGIRKSEAWKEIKDSDTAAIRNVFNNEFPKEEVKRILIHEQLLSTMAICLVCAMAERRQRSSREGFFVVMRTKRKRKFLHSSSAFFRRTRQADAAYAF